MLEYRAMVEWLTLCDSYSRQRVHSQLNEETIQHRSIWWSNEFIRSLKSMREVIYRSISDSKATVRPESSIYYKIFSILSFPALSPGYHDWTMFYMFLNMKMSLKMQMYMFSFCLPRVMTHESRLCRVHCPSCKELPSGEPPLTSNCLQLLQFHMGLCESPVSWALEISLAFWLL